MMPYNNLKVERQVSLKENELLLAAPDRIIIPQYGLVFMHINIFQMEIVFDAAISSHCIESDSFRYILSFLQCMIGMYQDFIT